MLITIFGGIFSIGGLYVSFDTMKLDVAKSKIEIERIDREFSKLDVAELRNLDRRLTRVETILGGINTQLDRIENSVEGRR